MLARLLFIWVFLLSGQVLASAEGMYIHTDGLGSPVARTDKNGNLISRTRYEPYGATAAGATPTIGFTGHVNDPDTGLIYMQQRYYDPYAGRFLSTDPVLTDANTGGGFNRYVYANLNPYRHIDPDGRDAMDWVHGTLTALSFCPSACGSAFSAIDGVAYAAQGDKVGAGVSFGAAAIGLISDAGIAKVAGTVVKEGATAAKATTASVSDLKLLHNAETIGSRPDLAKLSDKDLLKSVTNPKNGDKVKVSSESGKVVDGNSRVAELQKRAADPKSSIQPDTKIPIQTHKPDKSMFDF